MTDEVLPQLIINDLTEEQYASLTPEEKQLYLTPDTTQQDIESAISSHNSNPLSHQYIRNLIPTKTSDLTNDSGFISEITSSDVTNALGYTPYDSSNPSGYTSNVGTVTSVNNTSPDANGDVSISIPTVDQVYSGISTNAQSGVAVKSAIDTAISSVYKPAGSVAFASLPILSSSIEGNVYNISDAFTTTSDFVEGAGKSYPAGTNVVCIEVSGIYKWDVLSGIVDLSGYVQTSREINGKPLSSDISLDATDVGALPDSTVIPTDTGDLTNGAGFITSSALSGYATESWVGQQGFLTSSALSGYATETWVGQQGYISGITSSMVTTALGYTPYDSSNPAGYTSNVGTVTSVNNIQPVDGNVTVTIPDPLPSQTGNTGKFLTTDGTDASWGAVPSDSNKANIGADNFSSTGKEYLSGIGMPSSTSETVTLGASGATYAATKNGYFFFGRAATDAGQYIDMYNTTSGYRLQTVAIGSGAYCIQTIPAAKGDIVQINYSVNGTSLGLKFISAKGEV